MGTISVAAVLMALPMPAQVDVLTQRNDNARSALNLHETILNGNSVRTNFGKLWTLYSDAKIMAQPLYVSNLTAPANALIGAAAKAKCPTGCNAVIFASMKGTIYAYMADQQPQTVNDTLLWATYLSDGNACKCTATGPQNGSGDFDMWAVDDPWWGVLGTPVIDRGANSLYAVAWTNDDRYRIYNLNLTNGTIQKGPVVIQGSVGGTNFLETTPGWKELRKQRAGLLLANGLLYVAFGGDNQRALAGWLFVYDATNLTLKSVWSPTPNGRNGGIWQSGQGPAVDNAGNIYLQTGDGDFVPKNQSYGDSLLRLQVNNGTITVADYFSPCNEMILQKCDLDQGSAGPLLFHEFVVGGGKNGELYLMRANKLGGFQPGPFPPPAANCEPGMLPACTDGPNLIQRWQATMGHIHGSPVFWDGPGGKSWLYVMGEGDHLSAYPFNGSTFNIAAVKQSGWTQPHPTAPFCAAIHHWMPGGILSVSSNGAAAGTGVVWALTPANGDANSCRGVKGMLMAFDAEDVTKELWRSQGRDAGLSDTKDSLGLLARFTPPTIANGKVFVATAGDAETLQRWPGPRPAPGPKNYALVVYGLKR
jgi:hypothetical protein